MNEGVHRETLTWVSAGHTSHAALTHCLFCERELGKGPLGWHCTTQLGAESERSVSRVNDGTRDGRSGIRDAECSRIALKHLWCKASVATSTWEREICEGGRASGALSIHTGAQQADEDDVKQEGQDTKTMRTMRKCRGWRKKLGYRGCVIGCACACAGDDGGHRLPEQGHKPGVLIPSPAKIYALSVSLAVTHLQRASVTNPRCPSPSTIGHRFTKVPAHKGDLWPHGRISFWQ